MLYEVITAPFSPSSASTSPRSSLRSTPSDALTPGKLLHIPRISTSGAAFAVVSIVADTLYVIDLRLKKEGVPGGTPLAPYAY